MDAAARRARDREAFREFLEKHRYAPQGRYARVGVLEERDFDALLRGTLGPVWAWIWRNIKNAEDMETIKRNVQVARYTIDSCKQEREQARAKRDALAARKKYLEDSLLRAREREQALLSSLRGVEREQSELVSAAVDTKQREVLRRAFNDKNDCTLHKLDELMDQAQRLTTVSVADKATTKENQIDILLAEFKRMLKATKSAESVDFGDSDISHLRDSSGAELTKWILEAASRRHDEGPEDEEDAKYAAHVEEHSSSSHDALVQIQDLLRQSQAEHISNFIKTQKTYAKATKLKQRVELAMAPENAQYNMWSNEGGGAEGGGDDALAVETVDLQIESQVNAVALNYATRAYDDIVKQVDAQRQQKQELDHKIELMNRFDERQQDIVSEIRAKFRQNEELLQSLTRKQTRLLQVTAEEMLPRIDQDGGVQFTAWQKLAMDELRAFASLRLSRLDIAQRRLAVTHDAITGHVQPPQTTIPFEDLYINQIQDGNAANGYQRMARALGTGEYGNWAAILSSFHPRDDESTPSASAVSDALRQLEEEIEEDRSRTMPEAKALLGAMQQLTETIKRVSLSCLEDVVHVNRETLQRSIPELDQAIENWYHQPAWAVRLEGPSGASESGGPASSTSAVEMNDLLR